MVLVGTWTPIQLKPAWKLELPKVPATESSFLWRMVYCMVEQMFVRFGRSLGADDWSVWNEDSKQKALKLWNNLMSEAPDFFPVDKEFVRSPCIKDTSWRSWMNPAVGKGILESEVSGEGQ